MNVKEYKDVLCRLEPGEEKKQQIWQNLCGSKCRSRRGRIKYAGFAAAAIACVIVLVRVNPAVASNVKDFFTGFFSHTDNEYLNQSGYDLTDSVKTDVFADADGHVSINVLEMFSDGMTAYMTVRYTAMDEQGQAWLNDNTEGIALSLHLRPVFPGNNTVKYGVNWMSGGELLKEMSTDKEKYFCVTMHASGLRYASDTLAFQYPVTQQDEVPLEDSRKYWVIQQEGSLEYIRETDVAPASGIDFTEYEVIGDSPEDFAYQPEYLYVSGLSYIVKGKNRAAEDIEPLELELHFKDGTVYRTKYSSYSQMGEGDFGEELFSGSFRDESWFRDQTFNPQEAEKITIRGVEYRLRKTD